MQSSISAATRMAVAFHAVCVAPYRALRGKAFDTFS